MKRATDAGITAPAITIIGRPVALREKLNWFEKRPLFGQTIVVTRTRQQASELSSRLAELGARVIEAPTIQLAPPQDWRPIDRELIRAGEYDWIVFTSANGVRFTRQRLEELGRDVRLFGGAKLAAIGDAAADAVRRELALRVDLRPRQFVAEALADELERQDAIRGRRFLLLRADIARPLLVQRLEQSGAAAVVDLPIYHTRAADALPPEVLAALAAGEVNWITFTSSSTAKNFISLLGPDAREQLRDVKLASIGPITTATLRELGLEPHVQAKQFDIDGLVKATATG